MELEGGECLMHMDSKHPEAKDHEVYCDGEKLKYCYEASEEEGWAKCYTLEYILEDSNEDTCTYRGKIEIRRM